MSILYIENRNSVHKSDDIYICSFQREMVYSSHDSSPTRRLNTLPSSSGSPSRSRLSYSGGRPPSLAGSHPQHEQPRHPHHPSAGHGANVGLTSSPSAILERRDVKPDEEVSAKNKSLLKSEGLYMDPYSLMHEGRLSIASTQSLAAIGDPFGFPASTGLYRRGSVRSLSTYSAAGLQGELDDSLYKPGASLYSDTYSSATLGMGFRMAPSSPQKIPDMQLRERDTYSSSPRASPVRQTFRKDSASSSVFVESPKSRPSSGSDPMCLTGPGEGNRGMSGFGPLSGQDMEASRSVHAWMKVWILDSLSAFCRLLSCSFSYLVLNDRSVFAPIVHWIIPFFNFILASLLPFFLSVVTSWRILWCLFRVCSSRDHRLERMEAMEKQIASLTGLVQSVLTRAPDSDST